MKILGFNGLERAEVNEAQAGDIAFSGMDELHISDTLCDPEKRSCVAAIAVDEPTVTMTFQVNSPPFVKKLNGYIFIAV